jgi:hypothetical protein
MAISAGVGGAEGGDGPILGDLIQQEHRQNDHHHDVVIPTSGGDVHLCPLRPALWRYRG